MALVLPDRVQQTGTANTTVSFTLGSTISGFQSFASVGDGNSTYYAATDTANNWEVGVGTYTASGTLLTRSVVLSSSNSGSAVTFVGTVTVFVTYPGSVFFNPAVPAAIGTTTPAAGTFTTLIGGGGSPNYQQVSGAATGKGVVQSVLGADANIAQVFQSKGAGAIDLAAGAGGVNISNGGSVTGITRTATGSGYTSVPAVAITAPTTVGGVQATASPNMYLATVAVAGGGTGYTVNDVLTIVGGTFGIVATLTVSAVSAGAITAVTISANGYYSALPSTPASVTGGTGFGATFNLLTWGVSGLTITNAGSGYVEQPTVTFSGGGGSGAAAYATVGLGVIFRTLNAALDFYTPNGKSAFRVQDYAGSTGDGFWTAFGGNSSPILRSTGANSGSIQTSSGVPLQFGTNNGVEQFRVAHTASAVNYVQVTGAATGGSATISVQGSDANPNLNIVGKGTGAVLFTTNGRNAFAVEGGTSAASNFISVVNGATGVAPQIKVSGFSTDPDADLALTTKGTGVLRFGSLTTNADAPITGYITIKDSGGTVRKLAVIA